MLLGLYKGLLNLADSFGGHLYSQAAARSMGPLENA